jgi:hypothetical protein
VVRLDVWQRAGSLVAVVQDFVLWIEILRLFIVPGPPVSRKIANGAIDDSRSVDGPCEGAFYFAVQAAPLSSHGGHCWLVVGMNCWSLNLGMVEEGCWRRRRWWW